MPRRLVPNERQGPGAGTNSLKGSPETLTPNPTGCASEMPKLMTRNLLRNRGLKSLLRIQNSQLAVGIAWSKKFFHRKCTRVCEVP
jgi:hypothetical protein